jgi:hypothetical protein
VAMDWKTKAGIRLTQEIPKTNLIGGSVLYVAIMVFYALRIDRRLHGNHNR